jgi:hypothetical protein
MILIGFVPQDTVVKRNRRIAVRVQTEWLMQLISKFLKALLAVRSGRSLL